MPTAILLGLLLAASPRSVLPAKAATAPAPKKSEPTSASAGASAFDSTRAFRYLLAQCALGPRNPGSEAHARAIQYFEAHFKSLDFPVDLQNFTHRDLADGQPVHLTNILVTIKGRDTSRPGPLFCAHWDTRPRADQDPNSILQDRPIVGANDGASGVAVLMELANILKLKPPERTVRLVLFDGEDYGRNGSLDEYFLGARHYAENLPTPKPAYAVLLDMVGDKDLSVSMERNSLAQHPDLVHKVWDRAKSLELAAFKHQPGPVVYDDHMPLMAQGLPALDIIDFDYPPWHTMADTPDKCSAYSLGVTGRLVTSLARQPLP